MEDQGGERRGLGSAFYMPCLSHIDSVIVTAPMANRICNWLWTTFTFSSFAFYLIVVFNIYLLFKIILTDLTSPHKKHPSTPLHIVESGVCNGLHCFWYVCLKHEFGVTLWIFIYGDVNGHEKSMFGT